MSSLKSDLLNLNLLSSSHHPNDRTHRLNIICTRIYILSIIIILFGIGLILSLMTRTTQIVIQNPVKEQFQDLPLDAKCSCSQISIPYEKFVTLDATFHQFCSSDFVTDRWIRTINSGANSTYFYTLDFRTFRSAQFQALATFCRLSKSNVEQSISSFYSNTLVTLKVLSENALQSQTQTLIDQFRSRTSNTFNSQLRIVNQMTNGNKILSALQMNTYYYYNITENDVEIWLTSSPHIQIDGLPCACDVTTCQIISSGIYDAFDKATAGDIGEQYLYIPGISTDVIIPLHRVSTAKRHDSLILINERIPVSISARSVHG
ncbi:unnamed protein product [Adineta ricciae]|uniref:Uncharacterized protein n=1 Tax=Adineta ricciae TaxID=249248 RepID=A0A815YEN7_ADIRI|nr:unnamed protein product [Adineta ricciae]